MATDVAVSIENAPQGTRKGDGRLDPLIQLEQRVHRLLELVKRLKVDNALLEKKVRATAQKLGKNERDSARWTQDRVRLRAAVERILAELGTKAFRAHPSGGTRPRKRGDA